MLQAIREKAQGWIAWAIVILITIPFALWGIQEYLRVGAEPVVAKVNDHEIKERDLDQRYQEVRRSLQQQLGANFRPEMFDEQRMRQQVLDSMIEDLVIEQTSKDLGLYAGDEMIRQVIQAEPAFQKDGHFDRATYERALQLRGFVPAQYDEALRSSLVTSQLQAAVGGTEFATQRELQELARLRKQRREFSYLQVPSRKFLGEEAIPEQQLKEYYDAHQPQFRTPEQVKLDYLVLDAESLVKTVSPTDGQLREYFESHKDDYVQPEERRASHILVSLDSGAGADQQQAALAKIEAARGRILAGEDFATVAKEVSEDPGSASTGGDLGFFGQGVMDPVFEQATFAATKGEVTDPVRSQFGYHLILVQEIQPEVRPEFDAVRAQVEQAVRKQEAERVVADYAERLSNLSFEHPDSLEPAAEALGMKIQTSDWMSRSGGADELGSPEVVKAAFSDDVLMQGNKSEVIELGQDRMLVLRVKEHQEAAVEPLEAVRDQVVELVRKEQAQQSAQREAESLVKRLEEGATMEEVQAESGYELKKPGSVERTSGDAPAVLIREVFRLPRPAGDAATFSLADLGTGDYAVVALTGVTDGTLEELGEASRSQEKLALARSRGQQYYRYLVQFLRSEADITLSKQP